MIEIANKSLIRLRI